MVVRNVLVTGGSSGIGRAVVSRFAQSGDRVWFTYRLGADRAADLVAELSLTAQYEVAALELDQGNWDSHQRLAQQLPTHLDVLINNAAVGSATVRQYVAGPTHVRDSAFMQINSVGPLWLIRQFELGMRARGRGKIVNVASVGGGITLFPGFQVADGMSKAALTYMTRHLAAEWAHEPIDVFAICPGAVDTPMFRSSTLDGLPAAQRHQLESTLPGGRLICPEEIAEVVWWLCTEQACVLRGAVIDASMGLGVHPGLLVRQRHADEPAGK